MVLRVIHITDEDGTRWAFLLLVPIDDGITFEYVPLPEAEYAAELPPV